MNLIQKTVLGALVTTMAAPVALAEGRQIEEVIVTAERQEASIQDTSISITALPAISLTTLASGTKRICKTLFLPPRSSLTMQRCEE